MKANQHGISIASLIILIVLVAGGIGFIVLTHRPGVKSPPVTTTLKLESDPQGLFFMGDPICDGSKKPHKLTPYECSVTDSSLKTVITAPSQFTVSGKQYAFRSWGEGCLSGVLEDKRICRVNVHKGQDQTIKANFDVQTGNVEPSSSPSGADLLTQRSN